jgi:hypothetical protein
VLSDTVIADIVSSSISTRQYSLSSDATCNAADFPGITYANLSGLVFNTQANNGKYVCFRGVDSSSQTTYAISANPLNIDATPPAITIIDNIASGATTSETVAATIADTNISLREYSLSADATCNAADFPGITYTNGNPINYTTP